MREVNSSLLEVRSDIYNDYTFYVRLRFILHVVNQLTISRLACMKIYQNKHVSHDRYCIGFLVFGVHVKYAYVNSVLC